MQAPAPIVRFACTTAMLRSGDEGIAARYPFARVNMKDEDPPIIRLAHVPGAQGDRCLKGEKGVPQIPKESRPALLVSFVYLKPWIKNKRKYAYRDWVLDSGAWSAFNSGVKIPLEGYIDTCHHLLETDPTLTEVYSLDVIGDWRAGLKNTVAMWEAGVEAIPCFHYNEPWGLLEDYAKEFPKIAIGGMATLRGKEKFKFAEQCFARVWPKPIHGFGAGGEDMIMALPWHSVDATNWEMGPCAFGRWNSYGGKMSVRGSRQNLRVEVEWYLKLEQRARNRWRKEMEKIRGYVAVGDTPPAVRLAASGDGEKVKMRVKTLARKYDDPTE